MKSFSNYLLEKKIVTLNEKRFIRLYHGTHKDNVSKIKRTGFVGHPSRKGDSRGYVFMTTRPDVAFAYGAMSGEADYLSKRKNKTVPDEERAMFVVDVPKEWYNDHVVREITSTAAPEISFDADIPAKFIKDVVIGDRKKVYRYL